MSWAEVKNLKDKMSDIANSTLHIEGGTDLAGQEVIIKRYDSDYMKATLDSTGSLEVEVTPKSKYRVTSNDADLSKRSQDIEVGTGDLVNVELSYRKYIGKDVLPVDDVPTWLACHPTAGSYKYTTMTQVLADTVCLAELCSNQNALDYLMRSTTLFYEFVHNKNACATFSASRMANDTLRDTPAAIIIATASPYCDTVFPWSLPRITGSATSNSIAMQDGLLLTNVGMSYYDNSRCTGNAFMKSASDVSNSPYHISNSNARGNYAINKQDATSAYKYKYVPKCLIVTGGAGDYGSQTAAFSGLRYDDLKTWDTLGSVAFKNTRAYVDIAENDNEYVAFIITPSTNAEFVSIANVQMLGYKYLFKPGREI